MRARHLALPLPVRSAAAPAAEAARFQDRTARDLLPFGAARPCEVDADATLIELVVVIAQTGLPLVAVRDAGQLVGGITSSRLLTQSLTRP